MSVFARQVATGTLAATVFLALAFETGHVALAQGTGMAAPPPATALILGRVLDATTNRPMPGAVVRLGAGDASPGATAAMANAEGEFLFRDLEAGAYGLTAQASGYIPGAYGQRRPQGNADVVRLDAGARVTDVTIRLWQYAAITGRVIDESGDPVVDAYVRLLRRATVMGRRQLVPILPMSDRTDDRGIYRLGSLVPGEYAVVVPSSTTTAPPAEGGDAERTRVLLEVGLISAAAVSGARLGDWQVSTSSTPGLRTGGATPPDPDADGTLLVYPTVFHPAAVRPSEAAVVTVAAGEERGGVDVRLPLVPS
jgi:protocatechuate 3,4-dioxygenase beta subunit